MGTRSSNTPYLPRLRPLAACLAIAISGEVFAGSGAGISAAAALENADAQLRTPAILLSELNDQVDLPYQPTQTLLVRNCNDAGPDSLREAVGLATNGAAIEFDLNAMQCSTISLTTGQIDIPVADLTIGGPSAEIVTIDGGYSAGYKNRIFRHTGIGTLRLDHVELTDAKYLASGNQQAQGGCIFSNGTVYLSGTNVNGCRAIAENGTAAGGGVWALNAVELNESVVSNCGASSQSPQSDGGGIFAGGGGLTMKGSTISNNFASSFAPAPNSQGGGAEIHSVATIERSTISGNEAEFGGGIRATTGIAIVNSSITSNTAGRTMGGMWISGSAAIYNSTIAFNSGSVYGATGGLEAASIHAESSIFAKNVARSGGLEVELDVKSGDGQVSGTHNLIMTADAATSLPMDTLHDCPRLAPLLKNGGSTRTVALLPGSPAIDEGDDPFTLGIDQRGAGFSRVVGLSADIGAYEWSESSGDAINSSGFETCE